ncbi:recombinase family protein [Nostoc sp.]
MLIGYARVSTHDQDLSLQRDALTKAGCEKIYEDTVSGRRADRPGLQKAMEMLRSGDALMVWKLDRLGRSVKQLVELVEKLHGSNVQFRSLTDWMDPAPHLVSFLSRHGIPRQKWSGNLLLQNVPAQG